MTQFSKLHTHLLRLSPTSIGTYKRLTDEQKALVKRKFDRHCSACEKYGVVVERGYLLELIGDVRKGIAV